MLSRTPLAVVVLSALVACKGEPPKKKDDNEAPTLEIVEPLEGTVWVEGEPIRFSAVLTDDDELTNLDLVWDSDLDGPFGDDTPPRGTVTFYEDGLSVGDHVVTASVTDAGGLSASDTVQISVIGYDGAFEVDSTVDAEDALVGDGACDDGSGSCTLRAAIMEASHWSQAATITFAASVTPGTFDLTIPGAGEDDGRTGDLDIGTDLTILGAGPLDTLIDAGGLDRVLHILPGARVTLSGLTIQNGDVSSDRGGGILNAGTLTAEEIHIVDNRAQGIPDNEAGGGGLLNSGTATLTDCTIRGNVTGDAGGGVCHFPASGGSDLTLIRCTVVDNEALEGIGDGGGVANYDGTVTIASSTISGNTSFGEGGGLYNQANMVVTNSTLTGNRNQASVGFTLGDAIRNVDGANLWVMGSIIQGRASEDDCYGPVTSSGYNLGSDDSCGLTAVGDLPSTDPQLGPLQDNGGPTDTHALLPGSPAIDAIPELECHDFSSVPLTEDQRGEPRPQGSGCDIGSYEAP